jgi:hypothetical protein
MPKYIAIATERRFPLCLNALTEALRRNSMDFRRVPNVAFVIFSGS